MSVLAAVLVALGLTLSAEPTVTVAFDQDQVSTALGGKLTFETRIANPGATPTGPITAHLNVTSLDKDVYVDLEDWSTDVTREVDALEPGATTTLSWDVQAVNPGTFQLYVVLLPRDGPLVASHPVRVEVTRHRSLDAGGALPVVLAVPFLLGLVAVVARFRLRRTA